MINLTKKAATRFNIRWQDLAECKRDFWKIDVFTISRVPMLLVVHEYTLFTLVRRKSEFKTIEAMAEEIRMASPWYQYEGEISVGKNFDCRITGSINEMKKVLSSFHSPEQIRGCGILCAGETTALLILNRKYANK